MAATNLPTDLLRTFVTIVDLGGYTKAAQMLGRTQPAISLQMGRLQSLLNCQLFESNNRRIKLTEQGETLILFARQILRINDEAVAKFTDPTADGILRVGLPTDFAVQYLQAAISQFASENENVTLELHCDLSRYLLEQLHRDELDMTIALLPAGDHQYLARSWEERPIWVTALNGGSQDKTPLPLVSHPEGCEYRNRMISALSKAQRDWRIAYTSPDVGGLQQAVNAGLGVTALTQRTLHPDMRTLEEADGFPPLDTIRIGLFYKHANLTDAGLMLVNTVLTHLEEAAGQAELSSAP